MKSGYFPRFRPLMLDAEMVMNQPVDDAHISPIYFWQLNFFLTEGRVKIERLGTNALVRRPQWAKRVFEDFIAKMIRRNLRRRRLPEQWVASDEMLFGDCIIVQ